jgi:hypothetical protein
MKEDWAPVSEDSLPMSEDVRAPSEPFPPMRALESLVSIDFFMGRVCNPCAKAPARRGREP